jgi:hypothetical protein
MVVLNADSGLGDRGPEDDPSRERERDRHMEQFLLGVGLITAGAAMTPIGWVMFGKSRRPRVSVKPFPQNLVPAAQPHQP